MKDAGLLGEVLSSAAQVKLLVTSREWLNLQSEWLFEVAGMTFPSEVEIFNLGPADLEKFDATSLFLRRARQAHSNFSLINADIPELVHICRLVGGMPLGLELAAVWVRHLPLDEIARRIATDLDFLSTQLRDVPERHRSLRAVFNQTWAQLEIQEQAILRKLAIFCGGFQFEAAQEVAEADPTQLAMLVDKALLSSPRTGRYEIHELVRQFALEKLQDEIREYTGTMKRYSQYFMQLLAERLPDLKSSRQQQALMEIGRDLDNVRSAWRQAIERRDLPTLAKAVEPLWLFREFRGRLQEGEDIFQNAQAALSKETPVEGPQAEELQALLGYLIAAQGYMVARRGDLKRGRVWLDQGIGQMKKASFDMRNQIAASERELVVILVLQGEFRQAEALARDVLEQTRASGDRWSQAECLTFMGYAMGFQGHIEDSQAYLAEASQLCNEIGDRSLLVDISIALGRNAILLGDYLSAQQHLEEALAISQDFNDLISRAYSRRELARLKVLQGDYPKPSSC